MNIAIGICTQNNPTLLYRTLQSVRAQQLSASTHVICYVVDTSSTNASQRVIASIRRKHLHQFTIRSCFLPHLDKGIIYARKKLFSLVREPYLFILDDDVVAAPDWVFHGLELFKRFPDVGVIGGKTVLHNTIPINFLPVLRTLRFSKMFWPYALFDLGKNGMLLTHHRHYPCFANMAIRTGLLKSIPIDVRFATKQQPLPMFGGEDPDFIEQAKKITQIYYEPRMVASHHIKPHKFTYRYFLWRYYEWGKERALLEIKHGIDPTTSTKQLWEEMRNIIKTYLQRRPIFPTLLSLIFSFSYLRATRIITKRIPTEQPHMSK